MNIWFSDGQGGWNRHKVHLEVTQSDQTTSEELACLLNTPRRGGLSELFISQLGAELSNELEQWM